MTLAKNADSFATLCLNNAKTLVARRIRQQINKNNLLYKQAAEIFDVSMPTISKIMNHKEHTMDFDILHHAAVSAGMVISMAVILPD